MPSDLAVVGFCRQRVRGDGAYSGQGPLYAVLAIIYTIIRTYRKESWAVVLAIVLLITLSDQLLSGLIKPLVFVLCHQKFEAGEKLWQRSLYLKPQHLQGARQTAVPNQNAVGPLR